METYRDKIRRIAEEVADYLVSRARGDTIGLNGRKLRVILQRLGHRLPPPIYRPLLWEYIISEMEQRGWELVEEGYITGGHRRIIVHAVA